MLLIQFLEIGATCYLHFFNEALPVPASMARSLKKEFSHPGPIAQHNSSEGVDQVSPVLPGQTAGDPTVQHSKISRGSHKQVARVEISVPEVVVENLV